MTTPAVTPPPARARDYTIHRGKFTDNLITYLSLTLGEGDTPVLVGDSEAPEAGGWTGQQATKGVFVPYVTVKTGQAGPNPLGQSIGGRLGAGWRLSYPISWTGANRSQAEYAADQLRGLVGSLHGFVVNDGVRDWKINKSEVVQMGEARRNDRLDPPGYEGTDLVEIWVDKH